MTDNDYRIDDGSEKGRPNYTLRRVKFAAAVVGLVVSVTLMLTWHGGGLTGALVVEGVYLATALWLRRLTVSAGVQGRGRMAEACVLSSHIAFHAFTLTSSAVTPSAVGSNPAAGAWPDRQRRPHPRFVQLSWGCGNDGRASLLSWRPAVRLISINLVSINQGQGRNR